MIQSGQIREYKDGGKFTFLILYRVDGDNWMVRCTNKGDSGWIVGQEDTVTGSTIEWATKCIGYDLSCYLKAIE